MIKPKQLAAQDRDTVANSPGCVKRRKQIIRYQCYKINGHMSPQCSAKLNGMDLVVRTNEKPTHEKKHLETSRGASFLTKNSFKTSGKNFSRSKPLPAKLSHQRDHKNKKVVTQPFKATIIVLGTIKRRWRRVKREREPETIFVIVRRNWKIATCVGLTRHGTTRAIAVFDTGALSGFIKYSFITYELQNLIRSTESQMSVRDASDRLVSIVRTIELSVIVGSRSAVVKFTVVERVGTEIILGFNFSDAHVEAIRSWWRVIKLADGTSEPIFKEPQKLSIDMVLIPEDQEYTAPRSRPNLKVFVRKTVILEPWPQNRVTVTTLQAGLLQIEPYRKLYETRQCSVLHGIAQVEPGKDFNTLIGNFGDKPATLMINESQLQIPILWLLPSHRLNAQRITISKKTNVTRIKT